MLIVGQVSSKEEANEITFIAKLFIVGQRARFLASNKNADFKENEEEAENDIKQRRRRDNMNTVGRFFPRF